MGRYGDDLGAFQGTDKLSMAVQPAAEVWLKSLADDGFTGSVLFEGDRLFGSGFLERCRRFARVQVLVLHVPEDVAAVRRKQRSAVAQDPTWLQGRRTKVKNVVEWHSDVVKVMPHVTPADNLAAVRWAVGWMQR
jgi:hypothetical protein